VKEPFLVKLTLSQVPNDPQVAAVIGSVLGVAGVVDGVELLA
jgi:hypothetical protein